MQKNNLHECFFFEYLLNQTGKINIIFFFRNAHEKSHRMLDKKTKEKFRWPWEKIANKSLNMETDDDDAVVFGNDEQNLGDSYVPTGDT